jgi:hypothetical protein
MARARKNLWRQDAPISYWAEEKGSNLSSLQVNRLIRVMASGCLCAQIVHTD